MHLPLAASYIFSVVITSRSGSYRWCNRAPSKQFSLKPITGTTCFSQMKISDVKNYRNSFNGSRVGAVVRALASHQCGPGSIPGRVVFVVGSLLCSEMFFPGHSGFPLPLKTNISKFQFDSGMVGHF